MMTLHSLRLLIAVLIALTLLRPERVDPRTSTPSSPRVVVLWDGSGSM